MHAPGRKKMSLPDYSDISKLKKGYTQKLKELEAETKLYKEQNKDLANKEYIYRLAKSKAYIDLLAKDTKVTVIPVLAGGVAAEDRLNYKLAEGLLKATKENLKRLHANIDAYQSLLSIAKTEINLK